MSSSWLREFIAGRAARVVEVDEERLDRGADTEARNCSSGDANLGEDERKFIKR